MADIIDIQKCINFSNVNDLKDSNVDYLHCPQPMATAKYMVKWRHYSMLYFLFKEFSVWECFSSYFTRCME